MNKDLLGQFNLSKYEDREIRQFRNIVDVMGAGFIKKLLKCGTRYSVNQLMKIFEYVSEDSTLTLAQIDKKLDDELTAQVEAISKLKVKVRRPDISRFRPPTCSSLKIYVPQPLRDLEVYSNETEYLFYVPDNYMVHFDELINRIPNKELVDMMNTYSHAQLIELLIGIHENVDISTYRTTDHTPEHMQLIRCMLKDEDVANKIDIFNFPKLFSAEDMKQIILGIKNKVNIFDILEKDSLPQMVQTRLSQMHLVDDVISMYLQSSYSPSNYDRFDRAKAIINKYNGFNRPDIVSAFDVQVIVRAELYHDVSQFSLARIKILLTGFEWGVDHRSHTELSDEELEDMITRTVCALKHKNSEPVYETKNGPEVKSLNYGYYLLGIDMRLDEYYMTPSDIAIFQNDLDRRKKEHAAHQEGTFKNVSTKTAKTPSYLTSLKSAITPAVRKKISQEVTYLNSAAARKIRADQIEELLIDEARKRYKELKSYTPVEFAIDKRRYNAAKYKLSHIIKFTNYDSGQIHELTLGVMENKDISLFSDHLLPADTMRDMRESLGSYGRKPKNLKTYDEEADGMSIAALSYL